MRAFRWGLAFAFLGLVLSVALSEWDKVWLLIAAGLAAFGSDIAHSAEARIAAKYRGWKERRERQRHTEVRSDIAVVGAKVDQLFASLNRVAETAVAREDTEEAKAFRRAEYERIMAAFHEIIALYDAASEYGEMAADALRDISTIISGNAAQANEVEALLGLTMTIDRDHDGKTSAESKIAQIWERMHLYHAARVKKIGKDNALALDKLTQPSPLPARSSEAPPAGA